MAPIFIADPVTYERKLSELKRDDLIVIADFDHTITAGRWANASSFDLLGTIPRLQGWFEVEQAALFHKYHPYEIDPSLSKDARDYYMRRWWSEATELHQTHGLNIADLSDIDYAQSAIRDGWREFLWFCHEEHIPTHILSAWIQQIIVWVLSHHHLQYREMPIIANSLTWDAQGNNIGTNPSPPIYTGNKSDHTVDTTGKQILLFWDSIDDASMAHTRHDETTLRVAIHNPDTKRTIDEYLTKFDVVIQCQDPRSDEWYLWELLAHIR